MIPEYRKSYSLKLRVAEHEWTNKKITENDNKNGEVGTNYVRWAQRSDLLTWEMPYKDVDAIFSIFVYLMDEEDKPVSYARFRAKQFIEPSCEWIEMRPDPVINKI